MGLLRVADIFLWLQTRQPDWQTVRQMLDAEGVKTAAWAMLSWLRMLAPPELTTMLDEWLASVRPGRVRAAYMGTWINHDWPTRLINMPALIQLGFTLPMHDHASDWVRALRWRWQAQRNRLRDARLLLGQQYQWQE
jgi:hypothetical protein